MPWVLALQNTQGLQLGWGEAPQVFISKLPLSRIGVPQLPWLWKGERIRLQTKNSSESESTHVCKTLGNLQIVELAELIITISTSLALPYLSILTQELLFVGNFWSRAAPGEVGAPLGQPAKLPWCGRIVNPPHFSPPSSFTNIIEVLHLPKESCLLFKVFKN